MIEPGKYDITIYQGGTFKLDLQYKDSSSNPVNMTGYVVTAKLFSRKGNNLLATFTNTFTAQSDGKFQMSLTPAQTSAITEQGQYDVLIQEPGGDKYFLLQGNAFLDIGLSSQ